jgi:hypothetical protein
MPKTDNELLQDIERHLKHVSKSFSGNGNDSGGANNFAEDHTKELTQAINSLATHIRTTMSSSAAAAEGGAGGMGAGDFSETKRTESYIRGAQDIGGVLGDIQGLLKRQKELIEVQYSEFYSYHLTNMMDYTASIISGRAALDSFISALKDSTGALRQGLGSATEYFDATLRNYQSIFSSDTISSYENTMEAVRKNLENGGSAFSRFGMRMDDFGRFLDRQREYLDPSNIDRAFNFKEQNEILLRMADELARGGIDVTRNEMILRAEGLRRMKVLDAIRRNTGITADQLMEANKEDIMSLQQAAMSGRLDEVQKRFFTEFALANDQLPQYIQDMITRAILYNTSAKDANNDLERILSPFIDQLVMRFRNDPSMSMQEANALLIETLGEMRDNVGRLDPAVYKVLGGSLTPGVELEDAISKFAKRDYENNNSFRNVLDGYFNSIVEWFENDLNPLLTSLSTIFAVTGMGFLIKGIFGTIAALTANTAATIGLTKAMVTGLIGNKAAEGAGILSAGKRMGKFAKMGIIGTALGAVAIDVIMSFMDAFSFSSEEITSWTKKTKTAAGARIGAFLEDSLASIIGIAVGGVAALLTAPGWVTGAIIFAVGYFATQVADFFFPGVKDTMVNMLTDFFDNVLDWWDNFSIAGSLRGMKNWAQEKITNLADWIWDSVTGIWDDIVNSFKSVIDGGWDFISDIGEEVGSFVNDSMTRAMGNPANLDIRSRGKLNIDDVIKKQASIIESNNTTVTPNNNDELLESMLDEHKNGTGSLTQIVQLLRAINSKTTKNPLLFNTATGDE